MEITLSDVADDINIRLVEAARSRKSAMHTPVVGIGGDLRVMVLRAFDPETNMMRFHTDVRSKKVADIARDSSVSVVFYDPQAKIQIRAYGVGKVHRSDAITDSAWDATTTFGKRCYLSEAAPGSISEGPVSGLPAWAEGINPTEPQAAAGRKNFAILRVEITEFDWLHLANEGHRRARIGRAQNRWVIP